MCCGSLLFMPAALVVSHDVLLLQVHCFDRVFGFPVCFLLPVVPRTGRVAPCLLCADTSHAWWPNGWGAVESPCFWWWPVVGQAQV